jgi:polyisoprenoid-binding protein YceI
MKHWLLLSILASFSFGAHAASWHIEAAHSNVSFVSVKKIDVAEVHKFNKIDASLSEEGEIKLSIDLSSVDTGISIRDERMMSLLFEVAKFPTLSLTGRINPKLLQDLPQGATLVTQVSVEINLHGIKQTKTFDILVAKLGEHKLMVTSLSPVIVMAQDFELAKGVEKLRDIAGLSSIGMAVPVSFVLTLSQQVEIK